MHGFNLLEQLSNFAGKIAEEWHHIHCRAEIDAKIFLFV
jgi:hypothetical protein